MSAPSAPAGRVLVAGWFSFPGCGATAGDLLARDVACRWLDRTGLAWDVALAPPFSGGVDWNTVDPAHYSHVVFVGGPLAESNLLQRFEGCRLVGLNVSMLEALEAWNPFDLLFERDSSQAALPDLTFRSAVEDCPVVGVCLLEDPVWDELRPGYAASVRAIDAFVEATPMARVRIDTQLDRANLSGLRTPVEVATLVGRMDVVVTNRLHGMTLAVKQGVPAIAVDPVPGGGKISRQAAVVGWPLVHLAERASVEDLAESFVSALGGSMRQLARECSRSAVRQLDTVEERFVAAMREPAREGWGDGRIRRVWRDPPPGPRPVGRDLVRRLRPSTRRR